MGGIKAINYEIKQKGIAWEDQPILFDSISAVAPTTAKMRLSKGLGYMNVCTIRLWIGDKEVKLEFDDQSPKMSTQETFNHYQKLWKAIWENVGANLYNQIVEVINKGETIKVDHKLSFNKNGIEVTKGTIIGTKTTNYSWDKLQLKQFNGYYHQLYLKGKKKSLIDINLSKKNAVLYSAYMKQFVEVIS